MVFQENASSIDSGRYDVSFLVFQSGADLKNEITYQQEVMHAMTRSHHIPTIEKELRSNYDTVREHSRRTKRFRGRAGIYHIKQVTFSYYVGEQPVAVTVVSIRDDTQLVTVVDETQRSSIKKATASQSS